MRGEVVGMRLRRVGFGDGLRNAGFDASGYRKRS